MCGPACLLNACEAFRFQFQFQFNTKYTFQKRITTNKQSMPKLYLNCANIAGDMTLKVNV